MSALSPAERLARYGPSTGDRIARLVGPRARAIWACTFHSACVRILRREAEEAGYARDFSIYDADDQLRLIRRCLVEDQVNDVLSPRGALETHGRGGQCRRDDVRLQLNQVLHGVLRNGRELHPRMRECADGCLQRLDPAG